MCPLKDVYGAGWFMRVSAHGWGGWGVEHGPGAGLGSSRPHRPGSGMSTVTSVKEQYWEKWRIKLDCWVGVDC